MKVDLLGAGNQYGTSLHFARGLADALERQGVEVRRFWIDDGYFYPAMREILEDPPDLTCSFADISFQGKPLGDFWQIPHLSWLVDPSIYFLHQLQGKYSQIACVDQHDYHFAEQFKESNLYFLPHAADRKLLTSVHAERPYEAVFFGTCVDYEAISASWPLHDRGILHAAAQRVLSSEGISIAQALIDLDVSPCDLPRFHGEVDRYTRGKDRVEMIRSFPLPVHIWGDGPWNKYLPHHPLYPAISFDETLAIMKKSRIVLNSAPRFKAGAHERLFYASICGAAVYTGQTDFQQSHLPHAYTYSFGSWEPPSSLSEWKKKSSLCQEQVLAEHTWDQRLSFLDP